MKITMLFDSGDEESRVYARNVEEWGRSEGHEIKVFDAEQDPVAPCIGCFHCWLKTPGICVQTRDRGEEFLKSVIRGDIFLRISRISFGGYCSSIKNYTDRLIPLLHPYFRKVNGEMHHRARYKRYPVQLTIGWGAESREEEETFTRIFRGNLVNFFDKGAGSLLIMKDKEDRMISRWLTERVSGEKVMKAAAL